MKENIETIDNGESVMKSERKANQHQRRKWRNINNENMALSIMKGENNESINNERRNQRKYQAYLAYNHGS
jgi:hypothetical protein